MSTNDVNISQQLHAARARYLTRRWFLRDCGVGLAGIAAHSLLAADAGAKALTINQPDPIVVGEKGFRYDASSDEFGVISYEAASKAYKVGDKVELIVPHCDPVVNEYDRIHATRHDRVEAVWPITARGCSQ